MREKLRAYVDSLFDGVPRTRRVEEAREEMLSGCYDRFEDLKAGGLSEEEAYHKVISGIGDVDELLRDLLKADEFDPLAAERAARRRGAFVAAAVALYILSLALIALFEELLAIPDLGVIFFFVTVAAATGILIYGLSTSKKPQYARRENTVVEAVKEQMAGSDKNAKFRGALSSTLWSMILIVYLALSFLTWRWDLTWIIFLLGAALQNVIVLCLAPAQKRRAAAGGLLWTGTVAVYFIVSMTIGRWAWTWLLFLVAVCVQQAARLYRVWREME